jgi:hypothetical protein
VNRLAWTTEIQARRDRDQALWVQWQSNFDNPDYANEVAETDRDNSRWLAEVLNDLGQWPTEAQRVRRVLRFLLLAACATR